MLEDRYLGDQEGNGMALTMTSTKYTGPKKEGAG
jgi:hypothetical protein